MAFTLASPPAVGQVNVLSRNQSRKEGKCLFTKIRPYLPYILLLALGLAISGFFYFQLNSKIQEQKPDGEP